MIGCIIQARMGSTRLPGKVMMNMENNKPVLYFVINQLQYCKLIDKIIIATTVLDEDDEIFEYCKNLGIDCFRGSPTDVLDRYYQCAKKFSFSTIVRVTSDCPLIDPEIVDKVIEKFKSNSYDFVTNSLINTYPQGTEVEVFSFQTLESAWKNGRKPSEREHVSPYIRNHKDLFKLFNVEYSKNISHLRWTVDWIDDLELVRTIVSRIKRRPILLKDIINLFAKEPKLIEVNKNHKINEGYLKSLKGDEM